MTTESVNSEMDADLFAHLVMMLAHGAVQHLGGMPGEEGGPSAEPNLEGARMMIDLLEMLDRKTRGNRSPAEDQMLNRMLTELRLAFVQQASGEPARPESRKKTEPPDAEPSPPPAPEVKIESSRKSGESEDPPRFHKTYG